MAAPSYTTDLTDVTPTDGSGTWTELTGYSQGGAPVQETDFYIQGTGCVSAPPNRKTGSHSIAFDNTTNITVPAGECFFIWHVLWASNGMNTYASNGLGIAIGSAAGTFYVWQYGGSDVSPNPMGGWKNVAVDPTATQDSSSGTPTGWRFIAGVANITVSIAKGNLHACDMIRYGRGEVILTDGDSSNGYATFAGLASQNDSFTNQWGLFQAIAGAYLWKGLMSLGSASTSVDFRDSNKSISVDDTPKTYAAFNKIEVNNASSNVEWTGISITAIQDAGLGVDAGLSPGNFEMVDNATVDFDTCTFTDMGTFIFQSNATLSAVTFRRCSQVTQGGATISDSIFEESPAAVSLLASSPTAVTNCSFVSDGSNHAMELTAACAGNTYTVSGCSFSGYATSDGSTGNEVIYNNSGGAVTLNLSGVTGSVTVRNGTGASTTVNSSVSVSLTVKDASQAVISGARVGVYTNDASRTEIINTSTNASGIATGSWSGATPQSVEVRVRYSPSGSTRYIAFSQIATITGSGLTLDVTLQEDPNA